MTYDDAQYEAVIFYGDGDAALDVTRLVDTVTALTNVPLAVKAVLNHESPQLESFRKRRLSNTASTSAAKFIQAGASWQLFLFDERWSKQTPPRVLVHSVRWASGRNPIFFLAAFEEASRPQDFRRLSEDWFQHMNGSSGGIVRCPYVLPDGTSLEWAYRNNRNAAGDVIWRYQFDQVFPITVG